MKGRGRILSLVAVLTMSGQAQADQGECRTGHEGDYVIWNFDRRTSTLFDPKDIEDELLKIQSDAAEHLRTERAPQVQVSLCRNDALLDGHHPADLGDFLLAVLTAEGKEFEVRIVPYVVNRDRPRFITHWECTQSGPVPSINAYRSVIRAYAYAALALSEIRRLESQPDPCRVRHVQFFLEHALSALAPRSATAAPQASATSQLQQYLSEKREWLKPLIEAAAKTPDRCGMPVESSHLSELVPRS
jgi:hypothetical protein